MSEGQGGAVAVVAVVFIGLFALISGYIAGSKAPGLLNAKSSNGIEDNQLGPQQSEHVHPEPQQWDGGERGDIRQQDDTR